MKINSWMFQHNDQALLGKMARGGREEAREALRLLYERHASAVLSFLRRLTPDMDLAEDILQDSFLTASRNAARFREGSARPWLLSIAASRLRATRLKARRRGRREQDAARPVGEIHELKAVLDHELEEALASLPPRERAVLDLRFHAGLGFREAAEVLGVSLRTVKSWSSSGLERLRKQLGSEDS